MIVLYKLILAHLAGDFLFQPGSWVSVKETKKLKAWQLYIHALFHGLLAQLLVWEIAFWRWSILLVAFHLVIDAVKLVMQTPQTRRFYFFTDQLAHLLSIYAIWRWYAIDVIPWYRLGEESFVILIMFVIFTTTPCSYFVKTFISKWVPDNNSSTEESLQSAGKYIGIIERLLVFAFVVTHNLAAVGFLITAKSVFRFGDLREAKDRRMTEYVLIGTLSSFGLAMLCGATYLALTS